MARVRYSRNVNNDTKKETPTLDHFSRDLTQLSKNGSLDPVIGRENEVNRVVQILSRRKKNNPILVGEPGVGKSAIVSIPNFGYWKVRTSLLIFGKMPVTKTLPYSWHNTPNLHMCSIKDMFNFCNEKNIISKWL